MIDRKKTNCKRPTFWIAFTAILLCTAAGMFFMVTKHGNSREKDGFKTIQENIMLYNTDNEDVANTGIDSFTGKTYDIHDEAAYTLPDGLEETEYSEGIGFAGGCLFKPDAYKIYGETFVPAEWYSAGMISKYYAGAGGSIEIEWNENEISAVQLHYNHTETEQIGNIEGLCAPAFMVKANHDLYTASDIGELKEQGVDTDRLEITSDYWYIIFARQDDDMGFVISLNAKEYSKEDVIDFAKTVKY